VLWALGLSCPKQCTHCIFGGAEPCGTSKLYVGKPHLLNQINEIPNRDRTANSLGPGFSNSLFCWKLLSQYHVGELEAATALEDTVDFSERSFLEGRKVENAVRDHYIEHVVVERYFFGTCDPHLCHRSTCFGQVLSSPLCHLWGKVYAESFPRWTYHKTCTKEVESASAAHIEDNLIGMNIALGKRITHPAKELEQLIGSGLNKVRSVSKSLCSGLARGVTKFPCDGTRYLAVSFTDGVLDFSTLVICYHKRSPYGIPPTTKR
jgi:hypothetical protein